MDTGRSLKTKKRKGGVLMIMKMSKGDLLSLDPNQIKRQLRASEIVHIAKTLDAAWKYDYRAAKDGRVGKHAELKCGRHSDIFFASKVFLRYANIRSLMARQLVRKLFDKPLSGWPDWVIGIPDGATKLSREAAAVFLLSRRGKMIKADGRIILKSRISPGETVILVEDICTKGTALKEAANEIREKCPGARILKYELVLINRGGLKTIALDDGCEISIISLVEYKANDWEPAECPLCKMGSEPIKPKATDENWQLLTTSQ